MSNSSTPEAFAVGLDAGQSVTALHYAAEQPASGAALIVAHGAGAGQNSPFMVDFARALATRGFDTVTFNFPYTEQRRRLPDRAPVAEYWILSTGYSAAASFPRPALDRPALRYLRPVDL